MEEAINDVPTWPTCTPKRSNPYGSVPGLPDEELADPAELERVAMIAEWEPILALPAPEYSGFKFDIGENGELDKGAFDSMDFHHMHPFNKRRYKADRLREELRDALIMISIVRRRLPQKAMYLVLKKVQEDVLDLDDIASEDMRAVAKLTLRAKRLQAEIRDLGSRSLSRTEVRELLA